MNGVSDSLSEIVILAIFEPEVALSAFKPLSVIETVGAVFSVTLTVILLEPVLSY